jgi:predicted dehydrogenase
VFASGKKAGEKGLSVVAGTQLRHQRDRLETIGKIHEGGIGRIVAARAFWNGAGVGVHERQAGWTDMEYQLRNWYYYEWLCGDHIVEQHIHNLDVINWAIKSPPAKAVAVGGRQVRNDPKRHGNVWDHFAVDFEYPNGAHLLSMCRHWKGCPGDVSETVVGTTGMSNCHDSITDHDGKTLWKTGKEPQDPFVQEQVNLIESIRAKKPINEAEQVAISTLTAIMGRETAYTGKVVTWDEMMKSDLDLTPKDLRLDAPAPMRPVPVPGRPRKI